jgi:cell division protein FtsW (lipid II flippase)
LISIGSGGWFGQGYGLVLSAVTFLKVRHSDFIFSAMQKNLVLSAQSSFIFAIICDSSLLAGSTIG